MTPGKDANAADSDDLPTRVTQLLNDIRNTLLGVQVLLAGLVGIPFTPLFTELPKVDQRLYLTAVLAAVTSSTFLVAPGQYHRIRWHHHPRRETLRVGRRLATAGSVSLAVAVLALLALLTRAVSPDLAPAVVVAAGLLMGTLWYGLGLAGRVRAGAPQD